MRAAAEGEDAVHACIRTYRGVRSPAEVARRVERGFRPVLEATPGFGGYHVHVAAAGDALTTVSLFETREAALASAEVAAAWVRENLADLYDGGPPEVALDEVLPAIAT